MSQNWDPLKYAHNARFVADLGMPVVELLDPQPGEKILDLGCGDGILTAKLAEMSCSVVGVDSSPELIKAARNIGIDAYIMDGQNLNFNNEYDAVFSNAALHWMLDPDKVIAGVHRALRPMGRFVAECGGRGCVETIINILTRSLKRRGLWEDNINPWYFPSDEEYCCRLLKHGFAVDYIGLISRPTPLPGDISGWLDTFAGSFISKVPDTVRSDFIREVREEMKPLLYDGHGKWVADYIRLRFSATKTD